MDNKTKDFTQLWMQRQATNEFIGIGSYCALGTLQEMYFQGRTADTHNSAFHLQQYALCRSFFMRSIQIKLMENEYFML